MDKRITLDDWLFVLGIYPRLNAKDKFSLFIEMLEKYVKENNFDKNSIPNLNLKFEQTRKLSVKKKASFVSFLKNIDLKKEKSRYIEHGVFWITIFSKEYPSSLRQIYMPPVVIFYKGKIDLLCKKYLLGIVGARENTLYGKKVTNEIINGILTNSTENIVIVSGLAKGIDQFAHEASITNNGTTIGVVGTGLNVFYPKVNQLLQKEMSEKQLVISEYPLDSRPHRFHFPERNRIIAGLSKGILVVEAKKRSGSLITAYNGIDENRDIFAIPGSIFNKNQQGCNKLIQLGATLVQTSDDILKEWNISKNKN